MDRELKIAVSIFLVFLIYGLTSFFQSGTFATPIFLNQIILLIVAVLFYFINREKERSVLLLLYIPVMLYSCLIDDFTVHYISSKFNSNLLVDLSENFWVSIGFIVIHFLFWYSVTLISKKDKDNSIVSVLQFTLLTATLILFFQPYYQILRDVFFVLFGLLFIYGVNKKGRENDPVFSVLSYQLLLLILLEGMEYFL